MSGGTISALRFLLPLPLRLGAGLGVGLAGGELGERGGGLGLGRPGGQCGLLVPLGPHPVREQVAQCLDHIGLSLDRPDVKSLHARTHPHGRVYAKYC